MLNIKNGGTGWRGERGLADASGWFGGTGARRQQFNCTNSSVFERVFIINIEIAHTRILLCCSRID
jgi:hypothetical protein